MSSSSSSCSSNSPILVNPCNACGSPTPSAVHVRRGHVELIIGPMFSGKSTELLRRIRRHRHAKRRCLVIKYKRDTRYSADCVATHDRSTLEAVSCETLRQVAHLCHDYDVIGVDEGQFFPDLLEFTQAAANSGKIVLVAALDGTFQAKPFGSVCELIPLSKRVDKLTAVCTRCGDEAEFSKRLTSETAVEVIGGSESYQPMCRACYYCLSAPDPEVTTAPSAIVPAATKDVAPWSLEEFGAIDYKLSISAAVGRDL